MPSPIVISPNIRSGEPVFSGTRVPVKKNGFDYLKTKHSVQEFLADFPSVSRERAIGVIQHFEKSSF
ncbi:MAG: DUF433 domain-containing protein [Williamsia sp.]|nr:DUF433 domain-containing protein [Williamsia sp.]